MKDSALSANPSFRIRIAVPQDAERINVLFMEMLRTIYHKQDVKGYEDGYLAQYFTGGENRIYVAEEDEVVAFLSVQVHHEDRDYIYLDDFSVTEACRGRGIGSKLMQAAARYAEEIGIPGICLHVEKTNTSAFRFYERLGYSVYRDDGHRYLMARDIPSE